jgi:hypothetical protein
MNVLAIVRNSFVQKYFVESGYFPESATTTSGKVEHVETVALVLTGHSDRFRRIFQRVKHGSCHI